MFKRCQLAWLHLSRQHICPGDICPYQQYRSCYWFDFDQTFWTQFFGVIIFVDHNVLGFFNPMFIWVLDTSKKFSRPKVFFGPNFFWVTMLLLDPKCFFRSKIFFEPKFFLDQTFSCVPRTNVA